MFPFQSMSRERASDRWIEALLGARMRFHIDRDPASLRLRREDYWQATYTRWSQLYHGPNGSAPDDNPTAAALRRCSHWKTCRHAACVASR